MSSSGPVVGVLTGLAHSRVAHVTQAGEVAVLRYPDAWKVLSGLLLLTPIGMPLLALSSKHQSDHEAAVWIGLGFLALALPLAIEVFRKTVEVSDAGVRSVSPWAPSVFISWGDIQAVTYNAGMMWFVITAPGKTIRVPFWLSGLGTLQRYLEKHTGSRPVSKSAAVMLQRTRL